MDKLLLDEIVNGKLNLLNEYINNGGDINTQLPAV